MLESSLCSTSNYWTRRERYQWMLMLFTGCFSVYITRMAMPITIAQIAKNHLWRKTVSGVVLSCFFWGYALTQVIGGYLADKYGGDRVLLISGIAWSFLTLYTPTLLEAGIWWLLLARIGLGAAQGVHFPAMSSLIVGHLRQQDRSFFTGVVASGPSCGLLLIGSLGSIIQSTYGWQAVFKVTGFVGVSWCVGMLLLRRDNLTSTPSRTSLASSKPLLVNSHSSSSREQKSHVPWMLYFRSPAFWSILLAHFTENNSYFLLMSWLPSYFHDRFPDAQSWVFNMVPWIFTPICSISGGLIADHLIRKGYDVGLVRKIMEMLCQLLKAFLLPLMPYLGYTGALVCICIALATSGFHNSGVFINPQDIAPNHSGSIFGIMNTVGALPGFLGVYVAGYIVETLDSWHLVFQLTALLNVIGVCTFIRYGCGTPIVIL